MGFAGALDGLLLGSGQDPRLLAASVVRRERRVAGSGPLREVVERGVPADPELLGERAAAHLERLAAWREELDREYPGVDLCLDLAQFADQTVAPELRAGVGGRVYYDGLIFRAFCGSVAQPVGGGGRYDRLFHRLGAEVTAAGFAISLDRLVENRRRGGGLDSPGPAQRQEPRGRGRRFSCRRGGAGRSRDR